MMNYSIAAECLSIFFSSSLSYFLMLFLIFFSGWYTNACSYTMPCNSSLVGSKLSHAQSNCFSHSGSVFSLCNCSKYGWDKHCFTLYRFSGLNHSILEIRSRATGLLFGNRVDQLCLLRFGNDLTNLTASSLPMKASSSVEGVPNIPTTRLI
jgi:hypothetical protein